VLCIHNPSLKIIFHCKTFPWFVSDTTRHDFDWTLKEFGSFGFQALESLWRNWLQIGKWQLKQDGFWTSHHSFWNLIHHEGDASSDIFSAGLVFFKGDLNYRKMIYDGSWEHTTPFSEAIGPLFGKNTPFAMLRTLKSDLVVGLRENQSQELFLKDPNWMINGKWGMIQVFSHT
jgi:hypothetical protein